MPLPPALVGNLPVSNMTFQSALMKITTGAIIGTGDFYNIFRGKQLQNPTGAGGVNPLKGFFVPKQFLPPGYDQSRMFKFQFNPEEIAVSKETTYNPRTYGGLTFVDYIWASGGPKVINFSLFLDATAGSQTGYFVPGNPRDQTVLEILQQTKPRGVMPDLELLESFLNPEVPSTASGANPSQNNVVNKFNATSLAGQVIVPQFNAGGVITPNQFYAPPILIFVYGQFYLEGHLMECPYRITLFDKDLIARRAEVEIAFAVHEEVRVVQNTALTNKALQQPPNSSTFTITP